MVKYIDVKEADFFNYLENCEFPVRWMGNGSLGRDYFNENTKKLVATFSHGFVSNIYTLINQDGEGDDYTLDREEEFLVRLNSRRGGE